MRLLVAERLVEHRQQGQQDETGDRQQHLRLVDRVLDAVSLARREDGTEAIADRSIDQRAGDDADERAEGEDLQRDPEEGQTGGASCRERVCPYGEMSGVAGE